MNLRAFCGNMRLYRFDFLTVDGTIASTKMIRLASDGAALKVARGMLAGREAAGFEIRHLTHLVHREANGQAAAAAA